jgi:hypothetical protein
MDERSASNSQQTRRPTLSLFLRHAPMPQVHVCGSALLLAVPATHNEHEMTGRQARVLAPTVVATTATAKQARGRRTGKSPNNAPVGRHTPSPQRRPLWRACGSEQSAMLCSPFRLQFRPSRRLRGGTEQSEAEQSRGTGRSSTRGQQTTGTERTRGRPKPPRREARGEFETSRLMCKGVSVCDFHRCRSGQPPVGPRTDA